MESTMIDKDILLMCNIFGIDSKLLKTNESAKSALSDYLDTKLGITAEDFVSYKATIVNEDYIEKLGGDGTGWIQESDVYNMLKEYAWLKCTEFKTTPSITSGQQFLFIVEVPYGDFAKLGEQLCDCRIKHHVLPSRPGFKKLSCLCTIKTATIVEKLLKQLQ